MKGGSTVFFIFLILAGSFAGLGYLVPEASRQAKEIQVLQAQIEELKAELERAYNQNGVLSHEIETAHMAEEEAQAENQKLRDEIAALEEENFTALADLEEASELVRSLQRELENEREKYGALLTEKDDLEEKWRAADAKNRELSETLQDTLLANQLLQNENITLRQQLNAKAPFQEPLFADLEEMSFPSTLVQSFSSKFDWIFLTPVILSIVAIGGYRFHRKYRGMQFQAIYRYRDLDTKHFPSNEQKSATTEMVTIQIPRQQLSKYIMWTRHTS
jgi:DNA repair exonuclease SbcCD ATPase subunit